MSALSLVVVLAAAGVAVFRLAAADAAGRRAARASAERLTALLAPVRQASDLAEPGIRSSLAEFYRGDDALLLAAVYERGSGIRWSLPARSPYLASTDTFTALPSWSYPSRSALLVRSPLSGDPTGRLALDALYVTLPQSAVFSALRDSSLALGAWLLLLLGLILAARAAEPRGREATWTPAGEALPGSGAFGPGAETGEAVAAPGEAGLGAGQPESAQPEAGAAADAAGPRRAAPSWETPEPEEDFAVPELDMDFDEKLEAPAGGQRAEGGDMEELETDLEPGSALPFGPEAGPELEPEAGPQEPEESLESLNAPGSAGADEAASATPRGLYSPRSGLGWADYFPDRLDAELSRSASFEQDLSLLVLALDDWEREPGVYAAASRAMGDFWNLRDLSFERGEWGFAVILPNLDLDRALRMAEEFQKSLGGLFADRILPGGRLPVFMGLSSRAGRLVDATRLIQEAEAALDKAREEGDTHIMGFKPDPDKYRRYLASRNCD